jgi:hypothetical protein
MREALFKRDFTGLSLFNSFQSHSKRYRYYRAQQESTVMTDQRFRIKRLVSEGYGRFKTDPGLKTGPFKNTRPPGMNQDGTGTKLQFYLIGRLIIWLRHINYRAVRLLSPGWWCGHFILHIHYLNIKYQQFIRFDQWCLGIPGVSQY